MKRDGLFRAEAIAEQTSSTGGPLGIVPIGWTILILFLAAVLGAAGIFAVKTGYARKEAAAGLLAPSKGVVKVLPPRGGVVEGIAVQEGQAVKAGEPLFTLGVEHGMGGGKTLDLAVLQVLDQQESLLQQQIKTERRRHATEMRRRAEAIGGMERQILELEEQRRIQEYRAHLARDRMGAARQLRERGVISEVAMKEREEAWLSQRQSVTAMRQQVSVRESELADLRHQLAQGPIAHAEKIAQLQQLIADNSQKRAEVEARRTQVVQAPVSGRVAALQAVIGQSVDPTKPALSIVPEDAELVAELYVPSRAIGFVRRDQRVRLLYEAFPFQRFGAYWGRVESVTETVIAPHEVNGPVSLKEPSYKILVMLDRQNVDAFGRQVPLQANMALSADIVLEERSLLEWLIEPILSARGRM